VITGLPSPQCFSLSMVAGLSDTLLHDDPDLR
jgi:hypothetical protein